jgi:hypothetical protein
MKRLASTLSLALIFAVASCDDDDDKPATADTGVAAEAGTPASDAAMSTMDGAAPAGQCTGTFAGLTQTQLMMAVAAKQPPGKCASASDVGLICTRAISDIAGACGVMCVGMGEACIKTCVKSQVALSDDCTGCYAGTVLCAQMNCLSQCLADPRAAACTQCQVEKGCRSTFFACSGLPGGAPAGDGGAPAGDGGTAGDGGAPAGDGGAPAGDAAAADAAVTTDAAAADAAATVDAAATADAAAAADAATTD